MKVCWDRINELRYNNKTGKWYKDRYKDGERVGMTPYLLNEKGCITCGDYFFYSPHNDGRCCSLSCNAKYRNSIIPMSEETKKAISRAKTGKKMPEGFGETRSKKNRKMEKWKNDNPMYDPVKKEKRRQTILKNKTYEGSGNPNWKGGCEKTGGYGHNFNNKLKEEIRIRDNHACQNPQCKKISQCIEVHHIDYDKKNNEKYNLITLCKSCNMSANWDREWHTTFYQSIMEKRCLLVQ